MRCGIAVKPAGDYPDSTMISFIVPAHNEESCLPRTLQAIHDAARVTGQPYEIIVVDDASTDATAEVARQHNATVVPVNHRQIAATRNAVVTIGGQTVAPGTILHLVANKPVPIRIKASLRANPSAGRGRRGGGGDGGFGWRGGPGGERVLRVALTDLSKPSPAR